MLATAQSGKMVIPSDQDILGLYKAVSGYDGTPGTDQGAEESQVCQYLQTTGLLGHKSDGHCPIVLGHVGDDQIAHLKWVVQIFGSARLGVNLPKSAEDQFDRGVTWTLDGDQSSLGGHDMLAVQYDEHALWAVTWGKMVAISWDWVKIFLEEAHAECFSDIVQPSGLTPSGFHYSTVVGDLALVAA